ncbi:nitrogen fixation protein NifZ [Cupriavidus consociatus]|uniref:nitrogen fixation protein NifZ n=1 Tax=Cupriavidus consociatus TaxID=2821357 RepID=UPI001AE2C99A|nr:MULTISPECIES: nitrogen fixation protein NifZ [unclassified Cupriavidus]MBP0625266.1 nitrogen fixation protein NifZ [Cupriavidus sp. LEh25]MDK2662000.1 nitrogen fixation protein NifZ [Cupriavidus sp. LEh21]
MNDLDDDETIEIKFAPCFCIGERVVARSPVLNDGTYYGKRVGEVIANKGEIGYVTGIDTFLQRFYIYETHFVDKDHRIGMRARELCSLDNLPEEVLARLGERATVLRSMWFGSSGDGEPRTVVSAACEK